MPHTRPRLHILVLLPGQNPAAALEGALAQLGEERRMPHEIHVIAPRPYLADVQPLFSGNGAGRFTEWCVAAGFAREEILFNGRTLHASDDMLRNATVGADRMLSILRGLSAPGRACFTAAVARDAGALGHLLHAALHVIAGTEDRLWLDLADSAAGDGRRPAPDFSEVPLLLWPANEPIPATFADAVSRRHAERRRVVRPDPLRLDLRRRIVSVGDTSIRLPAMQFFWLYYLATTPGERFPLAEISGALSTVKRATPLVTQKLPDGRARTFPSDLQRVFTHFFPQAADKFEEMYRRACGPHPGLPSTISKINAALRQALGRGAPPYLIKGGRGAGGYRITLPASAIQVVEVKRV